MALVTSNSTSASSPLARTQIYLSAAHQAAMGRLAKQRACTKSEIVRDALNLYLSQQSQTEIQAQAKVRAQREKALALVAGMWKDREDMANPTEYIRKLRDTPRYNIPR